MEREPTVNIMHFTIEHVLIPPVPPFRYSPAKQVLSVDRASLRKNPGLCIKTICLSKYLCMLWDMVSLQWSQTMFYCTAYNSDSSLNFYCCQNYLFPGSFIYPIQMLTVNTSACGTGDARSMELQLSGLSRFLNLIPHLGCAVILDNAIHGWHPRL